MKNVLVSGYIGYKNFGDEVIYRALENELLKLGLNLSVLCAKNLGYRAKTYNNKNVADIIKAISSCDILISGGGSLLQNKTSNTSLLYYLAIILFAKILSKKVIIFSQGIEPIRGKFFEFLTKTVLKTCDYISVRDEKSQKLLENWNIKSYLTSDPAYSIADYTKISDKKEGLLVQLRDFKNLDRKFIKLLSNALKENYKGKISAIAFQDVDNNICEEFCKEFNNINLIQNKDENEIINIINNSKYIISSRLHGLIIAGALNAKPFALIYDDKIKTISDELNIQNIDLYCYNENEFDTKLKNFFESPNDIKPYRKYDWENLIREVTN